MSAKRKCPICGSETESTAAFCPVCKADLNALPAEMFPLETEPEPRTDTAKDDRLDPDSPIPEWMQKRLRDKGKNSGGKMDYKSFEDALFGAPAKSSASRSSRRAAKSVPAPEKSVYQPQLEIDPPLVEPDDGSAKKAVADVPALEDFAEQRPARKWDDPQTTDALNSRISEEFPTIEEDLSDKEKPLVEPDEPESNEQKNAPEDDPALFECVSPTKVRGAARYLDANGNIVRPRTSASAARVDSGKLDVDEDSLLGDLLKNMDDENKADEAKAGETVFFSGNEGQDGSADSASAAGDIDLTGTDGNSAAMLDRILRGIGYHAEGEAAPAEETAPAVETSEPAPESEAPAEEPEAETPAETSPMDGQPVQIKDDDAENLDIPWDLFGSGEMNMPYSPADPAYSTFSRKGIPSDPGSNEYQQRMLSSVLKRIINAETFIRPKRKPNGRAIGMAARVFWALLAIGGVLLILLTNISERVPLKADTNLSADAAAFVDAVDEVKSALVVVDYTPAYSAVLDAPAAKLLASLKENGAAVTSVVLDPAAMPTANMLFGNENTEWWPAGTLSIRKHIAEGSLPTDIYLITADASPLRDWAEQLSAANDGTRLHLLAAGQLETVADVYLNAGMVTDALTDRDDLNIYGGSSASEGRAGFAVLYLAALPFLAWAVGVIAKFLRKDPERGRRTAVSAAGSFGAPVPEKEAEHEH